MAAQAKPSQEVLPPSELTARHDIAGIIPRTIQETLELAHLIVRAGLCPDSYNDPATKKPDSQKVTIGIMKGLEVGIPPITALSIIAIINGRPCIWGDGAIALMQRTGTVDKIEVLWEGGSEKDAGPLEDDRGDKDHTPTIRDFPDGLTCVVRMWRKGTENPYEGRFSVRDARRANLWGKKAPWIQYPRRMLFNRARAFSVRDGWADALSGLGIVEEVRDIAPDNAAPADTSFLEDAPKQIAPPAEQPMAVPMPAAAQPEAVRAEPVPQQVAADPASPEATRLTAGNPAAIPVPKLLPTPWSEELQKPDYRTWAIAAAEIADQAPTPQWLDDWAKINQAPLAALKTAGVAGIKWHKALMDKIDARKTLLTAGAP